MVLPEDAIGDMIGEAIESAEKKWWWKPLKRFLEIGIPALLIGYLLIKSWL
jgi:hypothetical protein